MKTRALTLVLLLLGIVRPAAGESSIHPPFALKDAQGQAAIDVHGASDVKTCAQCHDTAFILKHNTHRRLGQEITCFQCHLQGGIEGVKPEDYDEQGLFRKQMIPPTCNACGKCHGMVHKDKEFFEIPPAILKGEETGPFGRTLQTGEVFSPQVVTFSHINLKDRHELDSPWDVHAERGLHCTACHFPSNSPSRPDLSTRKGPEHLLRDPRTLNLNAYLKRPNHEFAVAECEACHNAETAHRDLPSARRHMRSLSCQACHVPILRGPALESVDRTVVTAEDGPRMRFRGVDTVRDSRYPNTWFYKGYRPALLHETKSGQDRFAPFNLVTTWQWVSDKGDKPVPMETVRKAWKTDDHFHPELIGLFDKNHNGHLEAAELVLDTKKKTLAIRARLVALGVVAPRISAKITSHPIRHGVVAGRWVEKDCQTCHGADSRFNELIPLASGPFPGGVKPKLDRKTAALFVGRNVMARGKELILGGNEEPSGHYVLGHSRRPWSDQLGFWIFVLSVLGTMIHSALRAWSFRKRAPHTQDTHQAAAEKVYMYGVYERIWHWTMALSIVMLVLTGLKIHYPQSFTLISFPTAVFVHNLFAMLLLINAFLGMFYHLTTGEIRQFIPSGAGVLRRLWIQSIYYGKGIFVGVSHPFAKTRSQKLNPLQQFTYAGLLNVLFPFQIITGLLLWLAGVRPEYTVAFGELSVVAPLHNLGSWLFVSFLVVHVYLTTTGHTITSNIRAMLSGWDIAEEEPARAKQGEGV